MQGSVLGSGFAGMACAAAALATGSPYPWQARRLLSLLLFGVQGCRRHATVGWWINP